MGPRHFLAGAKPTISRDPNRSRFFGGTQNRGLNPACLAGSLECDQPRNEVRGPVGLRGRDYESCFGLVRTA